MIYQLFLKGNGRVALLRDQNNPPSSLTGPPWEGRTPARPLRGMGESRLARLDRLDLLDWIDLHGLQAFFSLFGAFDGTRQGFQLI